MTITELVNEERERLVQRASWLKEHPADLDLYEAPPLTVESQRSMHDLRERLRLATGLGGAELINETVRRMAPVIVEVQPLYRELGWSQENREAALGLIEEEILRVEEDA